MTDQTNPTADERIAQRQAAEDTLRAQLAALQLDGPYSFSRGFDPVSVMFGGAGRDRFAICLRCGAMVVLDDPEERGPGEQPIERSVRIHTAWHKEAGR